jgi:hypothetical protein
MTERPCIECGHPLRTSDGAPRCWCACCPAFGQDADDYETTPDTASHYDGQWLQVRDAIDEIRKRQSPTTDPRPTPTITNNPNPTTERPNPVL